MAINDVMLSYRPQMSLLGLKVKRFGTPVFEDKGSEKRIKDEYNDLC